MKRAGFFVLLALLFNMLLACGAGHDAETQIPTESETPPALPEASKTERSESQLESMVQESEIGLEERSSVKKQITVGESIQYLLQIGLRPYCLSACPEQMV